MAPTRRMLTVREQVEKLRLVGDIAGKAEVNFVIDCTPGDVAYIQAISTPKASQIVHPVEDAGYDIWVYKPNAKLIVKYQPNKLGVSAEDAAALLVKEYLIAKAKRIKKLRPDLSLKSIMSELSKGYQGAPETKQ